jgi:hypothetical protein
MQNALMRATVCFDPGIHRALCLKAAATDCTVSELVNEAVRSSLADDAEDLATVEAQSGDALRS